MAPGSLPIVLETKAIRFAYDSRPVLNDVNIKISKGEFLGIIGPNGAGKSTLLNLLNGLLEPGSGQVCLYDKSLRQYSKRKISRHVATVPQFLSIVFPYSVMEIVLMGRHPHLGAFSFESAGDIELAKNVMRETGVLDFADRSFNELSGGERQSVIIAKALAQDTDIILLDEPTSSLDIKHQVFIYRLLERLREQRGKTIVIVSHDINLASLFCQRLIMLKGGEVICEGTPADVITKSLIGKGYETEVEVIYDKGIPFIRIIK